MAKPRSYWLVVTDSGIPLQVYSEKPGKNKVRTTGAFPMSVIEVQEVQPAPTTTNFRVIASYTSGFEGPWTQDFEAEDAAAAFKAARTELRKQDMHPNIEGAMECPKDSTWHPWEEPTACDECQEMLDDTSGDGWSGLCPSCADKAEKLLEEEF